VDELVLAEYAEATAFRDLNRSLRRLRLAGEETSRADAPAGGLLVLTNCYVLVEPVE